MLTKNISDAAGLQPQFEAQRSFITGVDVDSCNYVMQLPPDRRCIFVSQTPDCRDLAIYIDYMQLILCGGLHVPVWAAALVVAVWTLLLVGLIMMNAELAFAPSLLHIVGQLSISEHLAGVTVLAVGNGFSDLVLAARTAHRDTTFIYNQSMDYAMFVTACVGGIVLCMRPLAVRPAADMLVLVGSYSVAILYVTIIVANEWISVAEATVGAVLYALFLLVAVERRVRIERHLQRLACWCCVMCWALTHLERPAEPEQEPETSLQHRHVTFVFPSAADFEDDDDANERGLCTDFVQFWSAVLRRPSYSPTRIARWVYVSISLGVRMVYVLMVPMVNESLPNNGWCKLGAMINMFWVPPIFLVAFHVTALHWYAVGLATSAVAVTFIACTSSVQRPPVYHWVFGYVGLATAVAVGCCASSEVVSSLGTLIRLIPVERPTVGLSVLLAIGNSLNDLTANVVIAYGGHATMALAGCFAAPMMVILLGTTITFLRRNMLDNSTVERARSGTMSLNATVFLLFLLALFTVAATASRFQLRRSIGCLILITYGVYVVFVVLHDLEMLHGYGIDHHYVEKAVEEV